MFINTHFTRYKYKVYNLTIRDLTLIHGNLLPYCPPCGALKEMKLTTLCDGNVSRTPRQINPPFEWKNRNKQPKDIFLNAEVY